MQEQEGSKILASNSSAIEESATKDKKSNLGLYAGNKDIEDSKEKQFKLVKLIKQPAIPSSSALYNKDSNKDKPIEERAYSFSIPKASFFNNKVTNYYNQLYIQQALLGFY